MSTESDNIRLIDSRVRIALRGTERQRGVVASVSGRIASVRIAGAVVPVIVPALPVPLVPGSVVEVDRPRGIAGQIQIARVLGVSGPAATATAIAGSLGGVPVVTELPVASAAWRGRTVLLEADGVDDEFHRCRRLADGTFEWVAV